MTVLPGFEVRGADATFAHDATELQEVDDLVLHRRLERFVFGEAELLDAREYDQWVALFAEESFYWVPLVPAAEVPSHALNHVFDDKPQLLDRLFRYETGSVWSQEPASLTSRVIGNVVASTWGDRYVVTSRFVLSEVRPEVERVFSGSLLHVLAPRDGSFEVLGKRVGLLGSEGYLPSLTFIL